MNADDTKEYTMLTSPLRCTVATLWLLAAIAALTAASSWASAQSTHSSRLGTAQDLANTFHNRASQIGALPTFVLRAKTGTRTHQPMANPSPQPLANLIRALDEPVVEKDWYLERKDIRMGSTPIHLSI